MTTRNNKNMSLPILFGLVSALSVATSALCSLGGDRLAVEKEVTVAMAEARAAKELATRNRDEFRQDMAVLRRDIAAIKEGQAAMGGDIKAILSHMRLEESHGSDR